MSRLRDIRLLPRSKAARDRAALMSLGQAMIEGFAEGIRQEEARAAAIPDGVDPAEWRARGLAESMAALDANPLHQKMVARSRAFWGLDEPEQGAAEGP